MSLSLRVRHFSPTFMFLRKSFRAKRLPRGQPMWLSRWYPNTQQWFIHNTSTSCLSDELSSFARWPLKKCQAYHFSVIGWGKGGVSFGQMRSGKYSLNFLYVCKEFVSISVAIVGKRIFCSHLKMQDGRSSWHRWTIEIKRNEISQSPSLLTLVGGWV